MSRASLFHVSCSKYWDHKYFPRAGGVFSVIHVEPSNLSDHTETLGFSSGSGNFLFHGEN